MGTFIGRDYRRVNFTLELGDPSKIYKICALLRIRCEKGRTLANDKSKFNPPAACCANPAAHKPRCAKPRYMQIHTASKPTARKPCCAQTHRRG